MSASWLRLAARGLWRHPRRSLLTAGAIAFGLACLIVFAALKQGLHREMVTSTIRLDIGSLQIHAAGYQPGSLTVTPMKQGGELLARLRAEGYAPAPRLKAPALVIGPSGSASVVLSGVDPAAERRLTIIAARVVAGDYLKDPEQLLIGRNLAASLGLSLGDELTLVVRNLFGRPSSRKFVVGGLFATEQAAFDRSQVFLPLPAVQQLLGAQGALTELAFLVSQERLPEVTVRLRRLLDADLYRLDRWDEIALDVAQLIALNDGTMNLLVLIIFFIVALGIANTMTMAIYERYREFGVLAALGLRPGGIVRLVLLETLMLGLFGALTGSLVGIGLGLYFAGHGIDLTSLTSANRYFATSHILHAVLVGRDLLLANLVTLATAFAAGLLPAWRASKLNPVEALRHL